MRLLPWAGEGGQPAYLSVEDEGSFVSQLADGLESVQLTMAERLLHSVESAWAHRSPGADMSGMIPYLCHALRDTLRVARSLRDRLPVADDEGGGPSAKADAVLAREIASDAMGRMPDEVFPETATEGPRTAVYRWSADPKCVGAARYVLRRHLEQWGMTALVDTAALILSELATNAVRHSSGPDDRLVETRYERLRDGSLRIEVHDTDDSKPERKEPSLDADSGRGLLLVDMLTGGRWGVSDREGVGKLVWAECAGERNAEVSA
jgi:anti-sigma regulatory factor (Ser/Thr protein kinase)